MKETESLNAFYKEKKGLMKKRNWANNEIAKIDEEIASLDNRISDLKDDANALLIEKLRENRDFVLGLLAHSFEDCSDSEPQRHGWDTLEEDVGCQCAKCGLIQLLDGTVELPKGADIDFCVHFRFRLK